MDWLNETWFEVPVFVILATGAAIALQRLWAHVVLPGWVLLKSAVHLAEIHATVDESLPILKELCQQFKPNHGTSVYDHITAIERRQEDVSEELVGLKTLIENHIASVRRGGNRYTDPQ